MLLTALQLMSALQLDGAHTATVSSQLTSKELHGSWRIGGCYSSS